MQVPSYTMPRARLSLELPSQPPALCPTHLVLHEVCTLASRLGHCQLPSSGIPGWALGSSILPGLGGNAHHPWNDRLLLPSPSLLCHCNSCPPSPVAHQHEQLACAPQGTTLGTTLCRDGVKVPSTPLRPAPCAAVMGVAELTPPWGTTSPWPWGKEVPPWELRDGPLLACHAHRWSCHCHGTQACVPHPMLVGGTRHSPSEAAGTHTASPASMWCVLRCPPLHWDHLVEVPCSPFTAGQHWDPGGRIHLPSVCIFWLTPSCFPYILEPKCASQGAAVKGGCLPGPRCEAVGFMAVAAPC